ncbi:MAG: DoxX family protein [Pseudomonadota bacterium]
MDKHRNTFLLLSRILMALIFIAAGADKLERYASTATMMQSAGVPGALLPAVIALELGGGLAILLGAWTRPAAFSLGLFCVVSAALFHNNFTDPMQAAMFMKNLSIAGGFLALAVAGAGTFSVDGRNSNRMSGKKMARTLPR